MSGNVRLDYIKANTKPDYLLQQRILEEFYSGFYDREYINTDYLSPFYRNSDPAHAGHHFGYNVFYKGEPFIYPKWDVDIWNRPFNRRLPQ